MTDHLKKRMLRLLSGFLHARETILQFGERSTDQRGTACQSLL